MRRAVAGVNVARDWDSWTLPLCALAPSAPCCYPEIWQWSLYLCASLLHTQSPVEVSMYSMYSRLCSVGESRQCALLLVC